MPSSHRLPIILLVERIGILTSGGDAPGMNAAVRAAVRVGVCSGLQMIGILRGYDGLIEGDFQSMDATSVSGIIHRGGTVLYDARSERFQTEEGLLSACAWIQQKKLDGLILIGGDGTFRGGIDLEKRGIATIGVPASIDDDIWGSDHAIGFDTAANTAIDAIDKIRDTATSHDRSFVVEVMGRTTGYLALMAGMAGGAEFILVPELPYQMEELAEACRYAHERHKRHFIVVLAEGVTGAYQLAQGLFDRTGLDVKVSVLGHIQRGGNPSAYDRYMASRLGSAAVDALLQGKRGKMVGLVGDQLVFTDYCEAVGKRKSIDAAVYKLSRTLAF